MCNQTALYWFSTYWFRASYPFRPLIHSALIDSDVAKQLLNLQAVVAPIDSVNDLYEQPHGRRLPDPVSRMAKLDLGLKDITVRLLHRDPPEQFTNGTRRERKQEGFRYALTRWSKFMKSAGIKVGDTVHYSVDENDQVLSVEKVLPYVRCTD
ncbi:hypothetical protein HanLR1_Chr11g0391021 [Helianthus annuus]|nr:hypothetical protein HanLR1_Chr11g0391021 [Helianthus annuus]